MAIKFLGPLIAAGEDMLTVAGRNGENKRVPVAEAVGALVVDATAGEAQDRVLAAVRHLEGKGSLRDALAAHCPHLPAKYLALVLALTDGLTEAIGNDGKVDAGEVLALVADLAREI